VGVLLLFDLTGDDIYRAQNLIRLIHLIEVVDMCMTDDGWTQFLSFPSLDATGAFLLHPFWCHLSCFLINYQSINQSINQSIKMNFGVHKSQISQLFVYVEADSTLASSVWKKALMSSA
jgi:hypothetical protein